MVRHKSRWFLVRIDDEEGVKALEDMSSKEKLETRVVEKKDFYHALRIMIENSFGIVGSRIVDDIQVRFYSPETKLAMLRVPRDSANMVRSAITFLTQVREEPIAAVVVSTSGSARTAKIAALRAIKKAFRKKFDSDSKSSADVKQLKQLKSLINSVRHID